MCSLLNFSGVTAMSMLGNIVSCSHRLKQIEKWIGHGGGSSLCGVNCQVMDVLACCVEPVQGDLRQLWSKSKSRHSGNTLDNFVVDLGSALEGALELLSTSEQTEQQEEESLESRGGENVDDNNDDQSPLDSTDYSSSWIFHGTSKKLISAMKGSRKKRGKKVGKLRVSWAPDVYDPPVTSQSHSVGSSSSNSHHQHSSSRHKKNNKSKAKPQKSSRKSKR